MYYGEELGMVTSTPTRKEDVKDPIGITGWPREKGRDGERTPMQWTPGPQAGFSTDPHTWLPVASDYKQVNVETESREPASLLSWYKQLIAMRRTDAALHFGSLTMLNTADPSVLAYVRKAADGHAIIVAVNCTANEQKVSFTGAGGTRVQTLVTDAPALQQQTSLAGVVLPAYGSWVARLD